MDGSFKDAASYRENLLERISCRIASWTQEEEDCSSPFPGISVFRRQYKSELCPCLYEPGIVMVTQGVKHMQLGSHIYRYDKENYLLIPLALPASTQVLEASEDKPCLGFSFHLDRHTVTEQLSKMPTQGGGGQRRHESYSSVGTVTDVILETVDRLFSLEDEPEALSVLAPLFLKELQYRFLAGDGASALRSMFSKSGTEYRMMNAIEWLKNNFTQSMRIEALAEHVHVSVSSLHSHFRDMTGYTPLQYQKWLRLNEARRVMVNEKMNAAAASYCVGYESPSHFNRDYKRLFGRSPKQDILYITSHIQARF